MKQTLDMRVTQAAGYLRVTPAGLFPQGGRPDLALAIREAAEAAGMTRILIDGRAVPPPLSELDRFHAGVAIAEVFGGAYRIAVLFPREHINKFAENTAVNRGARMFVTDDEAGAVAWLMRDN